MTDFMQTCEGTMNEPTNTVDISSEQNITKDIIAKMGEKVKLSDSVDGLELYCYTHCESSDSQELKRCRGVVFDGDNLVLTSFPYTEEMTAPSFSKNGDADYIPDFGSIMDTLGDLSQYSYYESHEGAVIRIFNHKGVWYTSTHRKLDADKSKWASQESFGKIFRDSLISESEVNESFKSRVSGVLATEDDILHKFHATLDVDKQYMFLICNNEGNRIVCKAPNRPTVYHVGTFVDGKLSMDIDVDIPYPKRYQINEINDLGDAIYNTNYSSSQGLIAFGPNNRQIKLYNPEYSDLYSARGNEPSVKFRYLQVRMDSRLTDMLYHLYPNNHKDFDEYENNLYSVAKNIYKAYVFRYIKRKHVKMPKEEYTVMKNCHTWHTSDRGNNKVNIEKVIEVMNERTPSNLNRMLKNLRDKSGEPVISEPKPEFRDQLLAKNRESRDKLDNMVEEVSQDRVSSPTIIELGEKMDPMNLV